MELHSLSRKTLGQPPVSAVQLLAFYGHFNFPLRDFWSRVHGFDIIGFDRLMKYRHSDYTDGVGCEQIIIRHYGEDAARLVSDLL